MFTSNNPLSKKAFEALSSKSASHSVSIYLPMHKKGKEQNEHLAQAHLKQCIKEVHKKLNNYQLQKGEIQNYLKPVEKLLTNINLWRNPSDGLAVFLNKDGLNYYAFQIPFETETYVANHFYLKPLLPLYHNDGIYYVLELSEDHVKLYEGSHYHFKDLNIDTLSPDQLEKAVGFDYKSKVLQFRTGQTPYGTGVFHGHGEGKDDHTKELITFFRAVDKGVKALTHKHQKAPLILACTESVYPLYKDVNSHPNLLDIYVAGDPEFKNKRKLHQQSWELVKDSFIKDKQNRLDMFSELYHTSKTSYDISDIIKAAIHGKVETLFIKKGADVFGVYDKNNNQIRLDSAKDLTNASLLNLAAMQTFLQGGHVYELEPEEMPIEEKPINAIFRY